MVLEELNDYRWSQPSKFLQTKAIYLAGPIDHCTYDEIHEWREHAKKLWLGKCFDPSDRVFDHITGPDNMKRLVEEDKVEISSSDALLVHYVEPKAGSRMTGTTMEIPYAFGLGKLVVVVTNVEHLSPWVRYHCHYVVSSIEEGIDIIQNFFDK
jgi:nucleoside 2-deoxyribosyltransferase